MACNRYFLSVNKPAINREKLKFIIKSALQEDTGCGDITTQLTIPKNKRITAKIIAKESFLLCGLMAAEKVFKMVDPSLKFQAKVKEGGSVKVEATICLISGSARSILMAERVALNILSFMSAIATKTRIYVDEVKPYKTKITDTRKTIPGLRELQKYAVRIGGGFNHRMRLDEMVLIKDNHLKIMGGGLEFPNMRKGPLVEIEAQNMEEFIRALNFMPDVIMLDNMSIAEIKEAIKIRNNTNFPKQLTPTKLEASGGINLNNVKIYAASGVDLISIGELTSSIKSVDISLEVVKCHCEEGEARERNEVEPPRRGRSKLK